jgi:hypothetical protein
MTRHPSKTWFIRGGVVAAALVGAFFAACRAEGPPRPTCADVSDAGVIDAVSITPYTTVTTDAQPPPVYGLEPDPGPQCLDCTQSRDLEIMTVSDFEDGFAPAWFNYGEPGVEIEPPQAGEAIGPDGGTIVGLNPPQPWWGLQVATLATRPGGERCGSKYALHMLGGRFSSWGGGYVTQHFITRGEYMTRCAPDGTCLCQRPRPAEGDPAVNGVGTPPAFMPEGTTDPAQATGCMFWASPVDGQPSLLGVDVSDFEGVSFWARRGPSGQSTLRVALIDDNTSQPLATDVERRAYDAGIPPDQAGARCERIQGCCRGCRLLQYEEYVPADAGPCPSSRPTEAKRCHVEGERLPHFRDNPDGGCLQMFDHRISGCTENSWQDAGDQCWATAPNLVWDSWEQDYGRCCPRTMEEEWADPGQGLDGDPRYGGKECAPYVFNFDYSSGSYCHDPGDILPERNQNRCDEGFEATVIVDTEWKLYTIPWSELRRFTPDKPPFDPRSVWRVAFYFANGYLDTYLDDVGFYRRRR